MTSASAYARNVDLGPPISYQVLEKGTAVFSSDGARVGDVVHVLAVEDEDVFDGITIEERIGPREHRFVDAPEIEEIHEQGVVLKLTRDECERLPRPSPNPAIMREDPAAPRSIALVSKLRRAWDYLSGNY
jgi:hypothetical protein